MSDRQTRRINTLSRKTATPTTGQRVSLRTLPDWLNLIWLLFTLGISVWSVQQAQWLKPSPSLITILTVAVLAGFVLAKIRLPSIAAHALALVIGAGVVLWQGLLLLPDPGLAARVIHLVHDFTAGWQAAVFNAPNPVTINVALSFGYLTWIIGYFSAWALAKRRNPWVAIFLGTIAILLNLSYWVADKYYYFLIYIVAALILMALTNYTKQRSQIAKSDTSYSNWNARLWAAVTLGIIVIAVSITWIFPGYRIDKIADYAREQSPFKGGIELYLNNFFAPVSGHRPRLVHGGQPELHFGGPLVLSDQTVFIINTDHRDYWKTQLFDNYISTGWKTSDTSKEVIDNGTSVTGKSNNADRQLKYTLIPQVNTDVLPTVGDLVSGDVSIVEKILEPQTFEISLRDSPDDGSPPADIASAARSILSSSYSRSRDNQQIADLLPVGLKLVDVKRQRNTIESITVTRDPPEDKTVVALNGVQELTPQKQAAITVSVPPVVPVDKLAASGANYPPYITDRYLQLPPTLPSRVKDLAADITSDSDTPYLKAIAVQNYLAGYPYTLIIKAPPPGADGVDYFLFTQKSGYCTYFASAMAVMLRSVGVPARMVNGYLPGQYDATAHRYILRDRDYHAWIEVYFPGYGWVRFEATPGRTVSSESIVNSTDIPQDIPTDLEPLQDEDLGTNPDSPSPFPDAKSYFRLIIIAGAGLILLAMFLAWLRIYKNPGNASAIYPRLVLLASLTGLGPKPWQTALEFSHQLSAALPRNASTIDSVVQTYVVARYGKGHPSVPPGEHIENIWPELRRALIKHLLHLK